jgi:hypothetical protein
MNVQQESEKSGRFFQSSLRDDLFLSYLFKDGEKAVNILIGGV